MMLPFQKEVILLLGDNGTQLDFKRCTLFNMCITKIDETSIESAEDLHLVMSMYNLLEFSLNYTTQQVVSGFIPKMKLPILMLVLGTLLFFNLLNIRQ